MLRNVGRRGIQRRCSRDGGEDGGLGRHGFLVLVLANDQVDARVVRVGQGLGDRDVLGLLDADPFRGDEHPGRDNAVGADLEALVDPWTTREGKEIGGRLWDKSAVYRLLNNPSYLGLVQHKDKTYPGEHEAIIDRKLWDEVQEFLKQNHVTRGNTTRSQTPAMLRGLLRCGSCGTSMGVTFSKKGKRRYRYYLCLRANKRGYDACPVRTVPAGDIEQAVLIQLRKVFQAPEVLAATLRSVEAREAEDRDRLAAERDALASELAVVKTTASRLLQARLDSGQAFVGEELGRLDAQRQDIEARLRDLEARLRFMARNPVTPESTAEELARLDNIWENLVPAEQQRIVELLVDQVVVYPDRIEVALAADGLYSIVGEMRQQEDSNEE